MKKNKLLIFNTLSILYLELMFNLLVFNNIFNIYIILNSIIFSLLITFIELLFNKKINKIITIVLTIFTSLLIISQYIYYLYYDTLYSVYSLFHGGQVFGFIGSIIEVIFNNINYVILLFIPLIYFFIIIKKLNFNKHNNKLLLIFIIILHISINLSLYINKNNTYSSYYLYYNSYIPKLTAKNFGVLEEILLDIKKSLFGYNEKLKINKNTNNYDINEYNITNINFNSLIDNETDKEIIEMHKYFLNQEPTNKNNYTGIFEGKNLIVITAEAFSLISINKELTPTLYKMYNESFNFTNFYTPIYYVSTSDGEYVSLTSLLPKDGVWSMIESSNNYLPYTYGNIFSNIGYKTYAYHNGDYTFYNRNSTHTNMGYNFKACNNGLNINCNIWPESDNEMINESVNDYINDDKFMVYYMTVSGHLQYNFNNNDIAIKNKNLVSNLEYNDKIKAYMATQIELDKALETLINKLDENNKLNDTVIVISADHYPYGLTNEDIKSYSNYVTDDKFDIHKNALIIWNNKIKDNIKIDKYSSSIDILPTILNLFNIEYDSRLFIGKDILSNSNNIVIFNDRSWITEMGKYNSITNTFTSFKEEVSTDYVNNTINEVNNKFLISRMILEKDYYNKIKDD